jgi:hypothetical protein
MHDAVRVDRALVDMQAHPNQIDAAINTGPGL